MQLDLFGDAQRTVTVGAEMSRPAAALRGSARAPAYRFAEPVSVRVEMPAGGVPLLGADAPVVRLYH